MGVLVVACAAIGLLPFLVVPVLERAVFAWAPEAATAHAVEALAGLRWISITGGALLALAVLGAAGLSALTRRSPVATAGTWDCGYAAPVPSMQYTSSSFAQMLVRLFGWALWPRVKTPVIHGPFASVQTFHSDVPDLVLDRGVRPAVNGIARVFSWLRWMQGGSLHVYILYILAALVAGFLWWR